MTSHVSTSCSCQWTDHHSKDDACSIPPGWASHNWSGYAVEAVRKHDFTSISGDWIVPKVKASYKNSYSGAWIGIDGFNNDYLIQIGTVQEYKNGRAHYYAFWETLPNNKNIVDIHYPVSPYDHMHAQIKNKCDSLWELLLVNKTKGWTFRKKVIYEGPGRSAEWIIEAPVINGVVAPLANYGKTKFFHLKVNRYEPGLQPIDRGVMIQNGRIVSTPSYPDYDGDAFAIAYGSQMPRPPDYY